jgi:hypothetical protein
MTPENKSREKRHFTPIPDGAFEKISLHVKPVFINETTGMGDTEFWIEREEKATECKLSDKEIAMQYLLRKVGHLKLSEMIANSFFAYRSTVIPDERKRQIIDSLSWRILDLYPPEYQEKFKKQTVTKTTFKNDNSDIPF